MSKPKTTNEFIEDAKLKHGGRYDYSKSEYISSTVKVKISCQKHGEFWQTPNDHLRGRGCPKCAGRNLTTSDFIKESKNIHGDAYDYSKTVYKNCKTKVCIICSEHGEFWQEPREHSQRGCGCPVCKKSKGELFVEKVLNDLNLSFTTQYTYDDCRDVLPLPFDFKLDNGILIEYDGIQHFEPRERFGGHLQFILQRKHDDIKNEFCDKNGLTLIRIPYTMSRQSIKQLLENI
jgi:hypothetical protein